MIITIKEKNMKYKEDKVRGAGVSLYDSQWVYLLSYQKEIGAKNVSQVIQDIIDKHIKNKGTTP